MVFGLDYKKPALVELETGRLNILDIEFDIDTKDDLNDLLQD